MELSGITIVGVLKMPGRFALHLEDEEGNVIDMEEAVEGRQGELFQFNFGVKIGHDPVTGKVTGHRQYETLDVTTHPFQQCH